jgi:hypothetical protein
MAETTADNEVDLGWNPGRVLFGLSRIGYTPASAICDLIDNSVRAEAEHAQVLIRKEREDLNDRRRNNVREYVIIDDGHGMDTEGLADALKLGSPQEEYEDGALAKFGLGLKAAALSQGEQLELISAPSEEDGHFQKRVLSLPAVQAQGRYFASEEALSEDDRTLIEEHLPDGHGTIVRIAEVRTENHPSVSSTVEELTYKAGVIYYYFIEEDGLHIEIDDKKIDSFDVLFTGEADDNGKLNEHEWDGKTVRWIQKPKTVMLDAEANVDATVEVTQLPYPPIFALEERGADADIRERYRIEAGNYGFYVYRNKRLISWAERFGLITQHGDFYGFRGRLLIDDSADDAFNIDVKKASITLSDDAERTLDDYTAEYKGKSRTAWQKAITLRKERQDDDTNLRSNKMAEGYKPEDLPGEGLPTEEEAEEQSERDAEIRAEMRERLRKEAADRKREEEGREVDEDELTDEDLDEALREDANPAAHKIFRVSRVEDNALWEPYYDAENETSVRINKYHRFGRVIYEDNFENADMQVLFDLMMLQLAQSEVYARKKLTSHEEDTVKEITAAYRRFVSEFLAGMCRKLDGELPRSDD